MLLASHIALTCSTTLSFDQVHFKHEQPQVRLSDSHLGIGRIQQNTGHSQRPLSISTQCLACGLTNGHIEIRGNSLEDPGVMNTKSD